MSEWVSESVIYVFKCEWVSNIFFLLQIFSKPNNTRYTIYTSKTSDIGDTRNTRNTHNTRKKSNTSNVFCSNLWRCVDDNPQTENEKEVNIWRRKIFGPRRRKRTDEEKEESFAEGKLLMTPTNWAICFFESKKIEKGQWFAIYKLRSIACTHSLVLCLYQSRAKAVSCTTRLSSICQHPKNREI